MFKPKPPANQATSDVGVLAHGTLLSQRYRILKVLGKGGYGQTYLAHDEHLPGQPICVVKQLKPQDCSAEHLAMARRLFNTEAEVLYKLGSHAQIPQLYAHFEDRQEFYLVQEYIEGQDLATILESTDAWNEEQVTAFLHDILRVLAAVHRQNVIHRDVKPSNMIRRCQSHQLVLIDFGAVKTVTTQTVGHDGQLQQTVAVGTQGFMPIEQQQGNPQFSSDLFAVGMVCIQALTGLHPGRNQFPREVKSHKILWRSRAKHPISPELAQIIDKMVCDRYQDRYPSAEAVLQDLPTALLNQPVPDQPPAATENPATLAVAPATPQPQMTTLPSAESNQNALPFWLALGGAAILLGLMGLWQGWVGPDPQPAATATADLAEKQEQQLDQLLAEGSQQSAAGNYEEALLAYEKALKVSPKDGAAAAQRCYVLSRLERNEYAVDSCAYAIELDPNDHRAWWSKGLVLDRQQQYEAALAAYAEAIALKPDFPEALSNQGNVFHRLEDYRAAVDAYQRSIQLNPDLPETWNNLGVSLNQLNRYDEALAAYENALALKSDYPEAWNNRGNALVGLERYEEAMQAYEKSLQFRPDYGAAIANRDQTQALLDQQKAQSN
ncbi:serine/threonine-protein kinase [Sphaerothrix gracilis]|uniref:serine/threonine-protein kinase n=1 Tax=Sphaerothrix gracilis TaxID=3151835 RepID=UPI0031FD81B6